MRFKSEKATKGIKNGIENQAEWKKKQKSEMNKKIVSRYETHSTN